MIQQLRNSAWFKVNGLLRYLIVTGGCNKLFGYYLINEYPKSGGSWLGQMLGEALDLPFPRNRLPMLRPSIMHGHYLNIRSCGNTVIMWRDGRDVIVSLYYHSLFKNEKGNGRLVDITRRHLKFTDYDDIKKNLPDFIDYVFRAKVNPRHSWADFAAKWAGNRHAVQTKYETLRLDTSGELRRVVKELAGIDLPPSTSDTIAKKYSFQNQAKRKPGEENKKSFLRKGIIGDWKNHFSHEAKQKFAEYAGESLIKLGYENDYSWTCDE